MKIYLKIILLLLFLYCKTGEHQIIEETKSDENIEPIIIEEQFQEEQPKYPVENDDPYFLNLDDKLHDEAFRVLITKNNYQLRQIQYEEYIERVKDIIGDKEQLNYYKQIYEQINFKDWEFEGVIQIQLNPQTSNIEKLQYHPRYIPKMKQAVELFIQDISRYKFKYLKDLTYPKEFTIRVLWRIKKDPNLTEDQAKERAIEYLKKYVR
ncbi:MAG: hypothetical protein KatS3mg129_2813 [Leptospiraceae bacterium]|nr:MAG: hypothetical protein KatS3mg129_2813 [Leptospiraceae bacterium]